MPMLKCPTCGNEVSNGEKFCLNCGRMVDSSFVPVPEPVAPIPVVPVVPVQEPAPEPVPVVPVAPVQEPVPVVPVMPVQETPPVPQQTSLNPQPILQQTSLNPQPVPPPVRQPERPAPAPVKKKKNGGKVLFIILLILLGLGGLGVGGYFLYEEFFASNGQTSVPANQNNTNSSATVPTGTTGGETAPSTEFVDPTDNWLETVPEGELETMPEEELETELEEEQGIPYELMNQWIGSSSRVSIYPITGATVFEISTYNSSTSQWNTRTGTVVAATDVAITVAFQDGTQEEFDFQVYDGHLILAGEEYVLENAGEDPNEETEVSEF